MDTLKVFLNVGKQSLSLKLSAFMKLYVNNKIGWMSLSCPHTRQFSIQSFLGVCRAQPGSWLQHLWSLYEPQARDLLDESAREILSKLLC